RLGRPSTRGRGAASRPPRWCSLRSHPPALRLTMPSTSSKTRDATPVMQQYQAARRQHPEGLLFFRMGDFFELFFEDAEKASRLLGLTLTSRDKGEEPVPMAGVPARSAETYINRLIRLGEKVV